MLWRSLELKLKFHSVRKAKRKAAGAHGKVCSFPSALLLVHLSTRAASRLCCHRVSRARLAHRSKFPTAIIGSSLSIIASQTGTQRQRDAHAGSSLSTLASKLRIVVALAKCVASRRSPCFCWFQSSKPLADILVSSESSTNKYALSCIFPDPATRIPSVSLALSYLHRSVRSAPAALVQPLRKVTPRWTVWERVRCRYQSWISTVG
jgi:hypothetical protein